MASLPRVVIIMRYIVHYRAPVFDMLIERACDRYEVAVYGKLDGDEAFGGGKRDYYKHIPWEQSKVAGVTMERWPTLIPTVKDEKPDVLIATLNPRSPDCWKLPKVCRKTGTSLCGWSKIHSVSPFPDFVTDMMKRRLFKGYESIICYGHASANELADLGFPKDRIFTANNTIDTRRIFDESEQLAAAANELRSEHGLSDKKVLLYIARMDPDKRFEDVLEAWPKLRELDEQLTLVLAGSGQLEDELRHKAKQIDPERILFIGKVPEGHDYLWIRAADVMIQCGMTGLAINQSMAFGVPTVIADETGVDTEILEHDVTGWRYEKANLDSMVAMVDRVLKNDDERERITNRAIDRMQNEITIENMVVNIDACITDALARRDG